MNQSECLFCQHPSPQHDIIFKTEHFWVRRDNFPVNLGHVEIVSQRHVADLTDLDSEEWAELRGVLARTQRYLTRSLLPDGFNIGVNAGITAGQTIPHLHIHVIPRYQGDVPNPRGGVRNIKPPIVPYPE